MKLFDIVKFAGFDDVCEIYSNFSEELQYKGFINEIPYWLLKLKIIEDGGIFAGEGILIFKVEGVF